MGIDWTRMRPVTADISHLKSLVEEQALALHQWDWGNEDADIHSDPCRVLNPDRLPTPEAREEAFQRYAETSRQIRELIMLEPYRPEEQEGALSQVSCRVYPISYNPLFPCEWRLSDQRTILPDELPAYHEKWRSHIQAIRQGDYQAYLFEWYLYVESRKAQQFWHDFRGRIADLAKRENAWAKRMRDTDIPQRIMELPQPPAYPAPRWADWAHNPEQPNYHRDARYRALTQANQSMKTLKGAWNSRVAQNAKFVQYKQEQSFEEFLNESEDGEEPWIDQFLRWVAQSIQENFGLYYDWY